jgi:hypothetical protein
MPKRILIACILLLYTSAAMASPKVTHECAQRGPEYPRVCVHTIYGPGWKLVKMTVGDNFEVTSLCEDHKKCKEVK